ncbi:MAG: class I SAM-dependent methyltransferase [Rhodospirillaceae bacterium]
MPPVMPPSFGRRSLHLARVIWFGGLTRYIRRFGFKPPQSITQGWFNTISQISQSIYGDQITCLNYGYAPTDGSRSDFAERENGYALALYASLVEMVSAEALKDRVVLEVGSGRGGGANFVATTYHPRRMLGVELSTDAVAFCQARYDAPNLAFQQGDATALDLPDESVDVVLNVESAHCYPDLEAFIGHVHRVLKPGGVFLMTDCIGPKRRAAFHAALHSQPWAEHRETDITQNVAAALVADSERKRMLIERTGYPRAIRRQLEDLSACEGSKTLADLQSHTLVYSSHCFGKHLSNL